MNRAVASRVSVALNLIACCGAADGQSYTVEVPGHPGSYASSHARSVEGDIVTGMAWTGSTFRALRWEDGGPPRATCVPGAADAVSPSGRIVGGPPAFLFEGGACTTLPLLPADTGSFAFDIDDTSNLIVGWSYTTPGVDARAVVWSNDGGMWQATELGTFGGSRSNASDVEGRTIAGWAYDASDNWQPARWEPDGPGWMMRQLPTLGFGGGCFGIAGPDNCGWLHAGPGGPDWPAIWRDGAPEAIAPLDGMDHGFLNAMNAREAVGWCFAGDRKNAYGNPTARAVIVRDGELLDLNTLIDPASTITLREAWHINEAGAIAGLGFVEGEGVRAFVLRPCVADCNADFTLDFFDFLCYQNLFAAGEPQADCDGNGVLDFFDFLCFQNAFTAGCP